MTFNLLYYRAYAPIACAVGDHIAVNSKKDINLRLMFNRLRETRECNAVLSPHIRLAISHRETRN
jgi:hypothetical protein